MYQRRMCLGLSSQFGISSLKQIDLFQKVGFDGFFSGWKPDGYVSRLKKAADEAGMLYPFVHAPFTKMNSMWVPDEKTEEAVGELIQCVRDCSQAGVETAVLHAFIGFRDHMPTPFGLESFSRVVKEAEKAGVRIAFENTEGMEYLDSLMNHFKGSKHVGFCWDSGHEMCYNYGQDMLSLYGDRLLATHINDNLGIRSFDGEITYLDDLHLLPFDGIIDWKSTGERLKKTAFSGPITFELNTLSKPNRHENDAYGKMDILDYLTLAYMRACRVAYLTL